MDEQNVKSLSLSLFHPSSIFSSLFLFLSLLPKNVSRLVGQQKAESRLWKGRFRFVIIVITITPVINDSEDSSSF